LNRYLFDIQVTPALHMLPINPPQSPSKTFAYLHSFHLVLLFS